MSNTLSDLTIFVGGLISTVTELNLLNMFRKLGQVAKVKIIRNKKNSFSKGYAFVQVENQATCNAIIEREHFFGGRKLDISLANDNTVKEDELKRQMFHKIYIKNLPSQVHDEDIKTYFSKFGEVLNGYVIYDPKTQASKGFGYVELDDPRVVDYVLSISHSMMNKKISLKRFIPRGLKKKGNIEELINMFPENKKTVSVVDTRRKNKPDFKAKPQVKKSPKNLKALSESRSTDLSETNDENRMP